MGLRQEQHGYGKWDRFALFGSLARWTCLGCLYLRMADASANASAITPYFMLRSQLDTAVHVLANCTWL